MEIIPNSYIARVVLAYLYEEKLNQAAIEFCKASPYLREERDFVKRGFRPATCISLKLTALFREYGEIQQKVDSFVEKHGVELDIQQDLPLVKKVDVVLALLKQLRFQRKSVDDVGVSVTKKEVRKSAVGCKRKRAAPSPHPSMSSSTPEVGEPQKKRVCTNPASFIVLNDSGRNLSNLSHISPIGDDSTQESCREDYEGVNEGQGKGTEEDDEPLDVRKFPSIDLFSQTLLENENYPEKIADLINKGLESSMSTQTDPKEGPSGIREETIKEVVMESEPKAQDCQSFNFNFDELISNIVKSAVKDPVFDDILDDISSKAVKTQNGNEEYETTTTPPPETPLKDRLRKTDRKNYNPTSVKRSTKKVKVISDVPYYGGIPEGIDVEKSQPAAITVVKMEPSAPVSESLNILPEATVVPSAVLPTPTADQPVPVSTTQFYVIQPDNTTKLVDINQLQFPTQQSAINLADPYGTAPPSSTLVPITGAGIPDNTYFINVPNCCLEANNQLPVYYNTYPPSGLEQSVSNAAITVIPEPSPDKFLIFPSSTSGTSTISTTANAFATTSVVSSSCTPTVSAAAINRICSQFVPLVPKSEVKSTTLQSAVTEEIPKVEIRFTPQDAVEMVPKEEVKSTPQNFILNTKVRSNSTPSRKASHIRILNFHTPAKQSPLAAGTSDRIQTPGSAPPSVDPRPSRIPTLVERMEPIMETSIKQEPSKTPEKLTDEIVPISGPALNPNSVSNTPRVAKDPRTCVRVLSRSTSEEAVVEPPKQMVDIPAKAVVEAPKPMVEIPAKAVEEVQKKIPPPRILINDSEMEEWRRIRSVSKSNFDQHLRLMEEQRLKTTARTPMLKKRKKLNKKAAKRKTPSVAASPEDPIETPIKADDSLESMDRTDNSITDVHAKMLEDALASAKKPESEKSSGKTPPKAKTPAKEPEPEPEEEQASKIYVKIATPRKKTPLKASPKRRLSKGDKSVKKRRTSSPRKREVVQKVVQEVQQTEVVTVVEQNEVVVEVVQKTTVEVKQSEVAVVAPEPEPEAEPEPETPVKVEESSLSQVEETPPEPPKPVKDHPKLLAKKSSAEYVRKEQEESASAANTSSCSQETPPEKPPSVPIDCSFGTSLFLETPFKSDLGSIPITPRFLMPNQIENTPMLKLIREGIEANSSMKKSGDIHTPNFPITPGLVSTPKSINSVSPHSAGGTGGFNSRRTDYSSGSSYYKPDESEDLDKNLEAMLLGERTKRKVEPTGDLSLEKETVDEPLPPPEVNPILEKSPQKPEEYRGNISASSSDSSSTSGSSSSGSSSSSDASSPENTPIKGQQEHPLPSPIKPSTLYINALEARRQQQAELEAKKQRTIARMKNAKPAPLKKTERKFIAPHGFKSRKVVVARKDPPPKAAPAPIPTTRVAPSASSKRKNPTPRKVVLLEKILPVISKKHSPKRRSQEANRKSPRSSLPITEQDVKRILTPRKDQIIEGTYENENLAHLRCTPDIPDLETDKKPVYAFQSPERVVVEPDQSKGTPDSNKENQSLEEPKVPTSKPEVTVESSEEDEDFAYNECSLGSCFDDSACKSYIRLVHNEKKATAAGVRSAEIPPIKRMNIVMDGYKICLESQDPVVLFEESPKKLPASTATPHKKDGPSKANRGGPTKKSSKPVAKPSNPVPVPTGSSTSSIKAKITLVSAVRESSLPKSKLKTAERLQAAKQQRRQQEVLAAASKKQKPDPLAADKAKTKQPPTPVEGLSVASSKELPVSPSPKMPLKLDMKKKQQQQQQEEQHRRPSVTEPDAGNTESVKDAPKEETKEGAAPSATKQVAGGEFAIDAVLTHIHG